MSFLFHPLAFLVSTNSSSPPFFFLTKEINQRSTLFARLPYFLLLSFSYLRLVSFPIPSRLCGLVSSSRRAERAQRRTTTRYDRKGKLVLSLQPEKPTSPSLPPPSSPCRCVSSIFWQRNSSLLRVDLYLREIKYKDFFFFCLLYGTGSNG